MPHRGRLATLCTLAGVTVLAAVAGPVASAHGATGRSATVVKVVDGDSVRVRLGRRTRTIDLVGVRAPRGGACFAARSRSALRRLLPRGARVRVADERRIGGRGRYVFRRGRLVNAAMLRAGAARVRATRRFARGAALRSAARSAAGADRGLHGRCDAPDPPAAALGDRTSTEEAGRIKAALDGLQMSTFRTDTNSSDRADTLFCATARVRRTEEFTPRDPGAGPIVNQFDGSWAIGDTIDNPDGSLRAEVLLRADDPTQELRTLVLVLGADGTVRQEGQGATDSSRSDAACAGPPAGAAFENDTAVARQRFTDAVLGKRFDVPGIGITDACAGPRLRRTEGGQVVADGTLVVEWAVSDGSTHVGIVRVEDAARGSSRRLQIALPAGGTPELQEFGGRDSQAKAVTAGGAQC